MKKLTLFTLLILTTGFIISANNIEALYGKNDINLNNNYSNLYGNNFGSMLEFNQRQPGYMDIDYANRKIASINSENDSFSGEIKNLSSEIDSDLAKESEIYQLLNKMDLLLIDLKSTSAELYTLKSTLTDKEMRQTLQNGIEQNRQQIYDLNNRKYSMYASLEVLKNKIETSKRYVTVSNLFIRRNIKEINYLQECIVYSSQDSSSLDSAIEKSVSYQSKVDDLLNVSF